MDGFVMNPLILITGAGGFTGRHACAHFRRSGMRVAALLRSKQTAPPGADQRYICDLLDLKRLREIVLELQPDYILHLAGVNDVARSWEDPLSCLESNIRGTLHLLTAVLELAPMKPKILVTGSSLSFSPGEDPPRPNHPYALSKTVQALISRSWSHLYELPVIVAEPSNLIGPGASAGICGLLADYIARWEQGLCDVPFRFSSLTEKRNFLDVRDAVAAYEKLLLHGTPGGLYPIGSPETRSLGEVLHSFRRAAGRDFPYIDLQSPPRDDDPQPLDLKPLVDLGWGPRIPFDRSIRDILNDARSRLKEIGEPRRKPVRKEDADDS